MGLDFDHLFDFDDAPSKKKCKYCEKTDCTGEIEDHCTWCGGPYPASSLPPDADRFCCEECRKENNKWDEEMTERGKFL